MAPRVVVVGAGPAGQRTALGLRRRDQSPRITLIGDEAHPCYQRPALSKELLTQTEEPTRPPVIPADYTELDVDLRLDTRAVGLDTTHRSITLGDGEEVMWDRLVVATGVRPLVPTPWSANDNIHTLRSFDDLVKLRATLATSRRVVIIGAGVLGCEVAAAVRHRGHHVALVDTVDVPMARVVGSAIGARVADLHRRSGVDLHLGRKVTAIDGACVELDNGTRLNGDAVVVAVGAVANTEWLDGSGLELDDGVVVDLFGESSVPGIFAVGDVASRRVPGGGSSRQEHWTHAGESAEVVATNLLAATDERVTLDALPYAWSDQCGVKIQTLGRLSRHLVICEEDQEASRLFGVYTDSGRVVGAVGWNRVPLVMKARRPIIEGWTLADTLEMLSLAPLPMDASRPTASSTRSASPHPERAPSAQPSCSPTSAAGALTSRT